MWLSVVIGVIIGSFLGYELPKTVNALNSPNYSRDQLDKILNEFVGMYKVSEAMTDEILMVSYGYNEQKPRFFSKHFAKVDPGIYDIPMAVASASSSSAPVYFQPNTVTNKYDMTEMLIDGGVVGNNPSLYAYHLARQIHGHQKIRLLSIGTGEPHFEKWDTSKGWSKAYQFKSGKDEFMMSMDIYSADYYMQEQFKFDDHPEDYIRLETVSEASMDKTDKETRSQLKYDGNKLYDNRTAEIEAFVSMIIDERYGSS